MNKVYLVITEYNWFYDDNDIKIEVLDSLESAKRFLELQGDIILDQRKEEYVESGDLTESEKIEDYINVMRKSDYIDIYAEDEYSIQIYIEARDVMSM
jgi:hypothetical protein